MNTLDVDQEQSVSIDVEVAMRSGKVLRMKSPTLLPELSTVSSITACSADYFGASIEFGGATCECCNPTRLLESNSASSRCDIFTAPTRLQSASLYTRSTTPINRAANLQRLQRCSRCPYATVLYVKKKEVQVRNHESEIFRHVDDDRDDIKGKSMLLFPLIIILLATPIREFCM